jgi:WD40 repeat protein
LTPDFCENGLGLVRTYLSHSLENPDQINLHTAASDCSGNIHVWINMEQTDVIFTAHTKSITDLIFIQLSLNVEPMIATCSLDGSLKIWDVGISKFTPIYEHFSSKKWVFSI